MILLTDVCSVFKACYMQRIIVLFLCLSTIAGWTQNGDTRWYKGNTHTHSLWSDGDDYPEMIVDWYKTHGYQFLALSDHNVMLVGTKWVDAVTNRGGEASLAKYLKRLGPDWV